MRRDWPPPLGPSLGVALGRGLRRPRVRTVAEALERTAVERELVAHGKGALGHDRNHAPQAVGRAADLDRRALGADRRAHPGSDREHSHRRSRMIEAGIDLLSRIVAVVAARLEFAAVPPPLAAALEEAIVEDTAERQGTRQVSRGAERALARDVLEAPTAHEVVQFLERVDLLL